MCAAARDGSGAWRRFAAALLAATNGGTPSLRILPSIQRRRCKQRPGPRCQLPARAPRGCAGGWKARPLRARIHACRATAASSTSLICARPQSKGRVTPTVCVPPWGRAWCELRVMGTYLTQRARLTPLVSKLIYNFSCGSRESSLARSSLWRSSRRMAASRRLTLIVMRKAAKSTAS